MGLKDIITGGASVLIDSVGNAIDKIVTSDEEKIVLKNALIQSKLDYELKMEANYTELEKEITARWISDNEHFITRLVRPTVVLWVYILFSIVMLTDGNIGEFHIREAYIPVLETILIAVTVAYFGSRGYEKARKISAGKIQSDVLDKF